MILFHPEFHRREDPTPNLLVFLSNMFFFENRKKRFKEKLFWCHCCGRTFKSLLFTYIYIYLLNIANSAVEMLLFFGSQMTYFNSPCLLGGSRLKIPFFWGGLLRQASMIPWTPWVSITFVVGVIVEHVEQEFRVCCMALVLKQI